MEVDYSVSLGNDTPMVTTLESEIFPILQSVDSSYLGCGLDPWSGNSMTTKNIVDSWNQYPVK